MPTITESNCRFHFEADAYLKLDESKEYRSISFLGLKAVDLVFVRQNRIYLVEIKCWEYFKELLKDAGNECVTQLLQKLTDSIFLLLLNVSDRSEFRSLKRVHSSIS